MDATDPDKSLVPRLGILVVDITDQIRVCDRHGPHAGRSGRGGARR